MVKKRRYIQTDPYEFGFGTRVMKEIKVCTHCGNVETADKYTCSKCSGKLPVQTIFQLYQQRHRKCALCDTVLAAYMHFCPHCGTPIEENCADLAEKGETF